jgi:hypothetical protein
VTGPPDPDQTFADVFNSITLGGGRRRKRKKRSDEHADAFPLPPTVDPALHQPLMKQIEWSWTDPRVAPQEQLEPEPADAAIVRPYAWTRGRTKSTMDLRIEAMVTTSELGEDLDAMTQTEHRSIAELCHEPRSIAELATMLKVPLGVAKVLLGDMVALGLVIVHKTATGGPNKAHLMLMERVLSGLRRL